MVTQRQKLSVTRMQTKVQLNFWVRPKMKISELGQMVKIVVLTPIYRYIGLQDVTIVLVPIMMAWELTFVLRMHYIAGTHQDGLIAYMHICLGNGVQYQHPSWWPGSSHLSGNGLYRNVPGTHHWLKPSLCRKDIACIVYCWKNHFLLFEITVSEKTIIYYQDIRCQLTIKEKVPTDCQGRRCQLIVNAEGANWLLRQKVPTDHQDKRC